MEKYIPPERMTAMQIRAQLDDEFHRWDDIAKHGCSDPFWPDGANMNLTRNHIIHWYRLLREKMVEPVQLTMFDAGMDLTRERPLPPEVSNDYMVRGGRYPDRLNKVKWPGLSGA